MSTEIRSISQIDKDLHTRYTTLTQFERLSLAVQIERNEILACGLAVSKTDDYAPGLAAIAIALGYGDDESKGSINQTLKEIAEINRMK